MAPIIIQSQGIAVNRTLSSERIERLNLFLDIWRAGLNDSMNHDNYDHIIHVYFPVTILYKYTEAAHVCNVLELLMLQIGDT